MRLKVYMLQMTEIIMDRRRIYTVILLAVTALMFTVQIRMSSASKAGTVLYVNEGKIPFSHENISVSIGQLNKGDEVKLLFDPGYEMSIDDYGNPLKVDTPHRRVEIEVVSGDYEGNVGWVSLMNLSKSLVQ